MTIDHKESPFIINSFESYCTIIMNYLNLIWSQPMSAEFFFELFELGVVEKRPITLLKIISFDELIVPLGSLLLDDGCTLYGIQSQFIEFIKLLQAVMLSL